MRVFLFLFMVITVAQAKLKPIEKIKVLYDPETADLFQTMSGDMLHQGKNTPLIVMVLSSVGCAGCYAFHKKGEKKYVDRYGHIADFRNIDYFLTKRDLAAMGLLAILPCKQKSKLKKRLLNNQALWQDENLSTADALQNMMDLDSISLTSEQREDWEKARVQQLKQRQFIDLIAKVVYLPYFFVIDKEKGSLHIVDTFEALQQVLDLKMKEISQKKLNRERKICPRK